ncbi:SLC13 family permease [Pusillimonas noertemannii]|uniref:TrkA family protein n=1 Tax=Pusillimonas noertemannii TaxID=305977 RepID=A0A2U1CMU1_9BURK|nr:SLC13 family permease [Pusillimonas noertemannii]NYT68653.1 SLC13 family permease [Pusillimonas noertemannii]PVY62329.1 TrkA family protein [Pusillimonas noertemannii]TFL10696.1 SLC13 family permease [Pusillimonas noertemannii]
MTQPQWMILAILVATLGLFLYGRWRHDIVSAAALLAAVLVGLVPAQDAFAGFAHPAVVTVACVLILSGALLHTGVVDMVAQRVLPTNTGPTVAIFALVILAAFLSSFMNNVGALALLMPIAIQMAQRHEIAPGKILMPLSFATILGGMTTLIGTPSNLIVSSFRTQEGVNGYQMFDFAPVGVAVAVGGLLFIGFIGWRIVPARERAGADSFDTGSYLTEARVAAKSKAVGMTLHEAEAALEDADAQIISLVRNEVRVSPYAAGPLRENDVVLIEADPEALAGALDSLGLVFGEGKSKEEEEAEEEDSTAEAEGEGQAETDGRLQRASSTEAVQAAPGGAARNRIEPRSNLNAEGDDGDINAKSHGDSHGDGNGIDEAGEPLQDEEEQSKKIERSAKLDDAELIELVILPGSSLLGRSASDLDLRKRYGINLLAISRQGSRIHSRVRHTALRDGDVLLMQGAGELVSEFASDTGCAPLAPRSLRSPDRKKMFTAAGIMILSVGLTAAGLLPAAISFLLGVLLVMVLRVLPLRKMYESVDWPVIVLLGALLPVAQAAEDTGLAKLIAVFLLENVAQGNAILALAVVLAVTMTLSDVINNAATAAIMCPIAIGTANQLGVSADPYLMAVAIGASAAFLTPIGHQNNTLILGPGGFRFGDYWRLGLPLEIALGIVAIPMLLLVWPL